MVMSVPPQPLRDRDPSDLVRAVVELALFPPAPLGTLVAGSGVRGGGARVRDPPDHTLQHDGPVGHRPRLPASVRVCQRRWATQPVPSATALIAARVAVMFRR